MGFLKMILLSSMLLFSSCAVVYHKHDNGKHKGWFKNPNNPHNPAHSTATNSNSGNGKGKAKGKNK